MIEVSKLFQEIPSSSYLRHLLDLISEFDSVVRLGQSESVPLVVVNIVL